MGEYCSKFVDSVRHPSSSSLVLFGAYSWTDTNEWHAFLHPSRAYHFLEKMVDMYRTTRLL